MLTLTLKTEAHKQGEIKSYEIKLDQRRLWLIFFKVFKKVFSASFLDFED